MLNPRLKSLAQGALPSFIMRWIDPVQTVLEEEVRAAAAQSGEGDVVLDAGAGEAQYRRCFSRVTYVAVDIGHGDPAWDYSALDVQGDLEHLPLKSSSVDRALCLVVLEHTRNPREVLKELARVLKSGASLHMVVPFLWEEHQAPNDYFRFTRYGVRLLFEDLPLRVNLLSPMGGFFWVCARRCVNLLTFFQKGWRWIIFPVLAPLFGVLFPSILYFLDSLDQSKNFSLGFVVRAVKVDRDC